ncbi:MAG: T9SS type A sorting domain-containing protein [Bacteroidetes bacterium]|nr:T9SS type A sorting domain-containing protein [Bacteroidota bacterium]
MDCDPNNGVANVYPSSSPNFFYAKYSNIITNVENISNPQDYEFTAYPNPTIDFLNLHIMQNCTNCFYTLQFIDISGKVVFQNTYNKEDISINIENLTSGTYLITINSTSLSMSKIFIKK